VELAEAAGIPMASGDFSLYDVYVADEAFLTTPSFSILPVRVCHSVPAREAGDADPAGAVERSCRC
jgi:hypothetical protein